MTTESATEKLPIAEPSSDTCDRPSGTKGTAHIWAWQWEGNIWTGKVRCGACGIVRENNRNDGESRGVTA